MDKTSFTQRFLLSICISGMLLSACLIASNTHAAVQQTNEASLRAAVVLGILRFTEWHSDHQSLEHLTICYAGSPSSSQRLIQANRKMKLKGRLVNVVDAQGFSPEQVEQECHVLLLGKEMARSQLSVLSGNKFLTICDNCKVSDYTAINLLRNRNRIGFEVNLEHAKASNIVFSSSLLELASNIKE